MLHPCAVSVILVPFCGQTIPNALLNVAFEHHHVTYLITLVTYLFLSLIYLLPSMTYLLMFASNLITFYAY